MKTNDLCVCVALNDTVDQMHMIDIYRAFQPISSDYAFFSGAHGTFSRVDHMMGQKTSLNKVKKIEVMPSIFSDHNAK